MYTYNGLITKNKNIVQNVNFVIQRMLTVFKETYISFLKNHGFRKLNLYIVLTIFFPNSIVLLSEALLDFPHGHSRPN